MIEVAVSTTWAWIHSQLDRGRKYRVHATNGDGKTLCGLRADSCWEFDDCEKQTFLNDIWACKRCVKHIEVKV